MIKLEELVKREKNETVIFLNTTNFHWVKMSKRKFNEETSTTERKEAFEKYLQERYQLLDETENKEDEIQSVYFSVTGKCNLNCSFCTMNSGPHVGTENDLTLQEIKEELIPKLRKLSLKKIVITGGEPLVRMDIEEVLSLFAAEFGREKIVFQTNGLLLSPEFIKRNFERIGILEVSIENLFDNPKLLARMETVFKAANESDVFLSLSYVIDQKSLLYVYKGIDLCHKYHAALTTRIVTLMGRAKEDKTAKELALSEYAHIKIQHEIISYLLKKQYLEETLAGSYLADLQPKQNCGAYGKILAIHPDGTTYMCGNFKDKKFSMGNIRQLSIEEIQVDLKNKKQAEKYQQIFRVDKNKGCIGCEYQYFCPGPCAAEMAESEDRLAGTDKCIYTKLMLDYAMYYYRRNESIESALTRIASYLNVVIFERFQGHKDFIKGE
ncbi:radical SAM protein with 4Fe4S-binding SPASM domain [Aequitasia blattaphilus]|uniref:Radical SAM protein n=1 Tax=Aequitasia blattaphilus TaxID=2949332 RepID=A0ABT1EBZ1_9FIRM|nr:radical SAM protein [Aequitasia blattaphilus]MCP1103355.1 radical SAM protein [Aequitasia blattaphilus]MCR8615995.1 radical SAM protein [Aequitasia blattaphilus]